MTILKAAVIGDPISHSLSPKLHNFWLKKYNIDGEYTAIQVKNLNFEKDVMSIVDAGFAGFNVTIPHKEKIFNLCTTKTSKALLTKAVNTVTIDKNKNLTGDNSDVFGFLNNFKYHQPYFNLKNKNAFVIGAGGAARAILFGLISEQIKNIFITNRDEKRAQNLISDFRNFANEKKCNLFFLDKKSFEKKLPECDLLVNSTSLGMQGQEELFLNISTLKKSAIVYDIVYKPLFTNLLKNSQNQGNKIVTGLGMLAFQAAIGFEYWFHKKPEINDELLEFLQK